MNLAIILGTINMLIVLMKTPFDLLAYLMIFFGYLFCALVSGAIIISILNSYLGQLVNNRDQSFADWYQRKFHGPAGSIQESIEDISDSPYMDSTERRKQRIHYAMISLLFFIEFISLFKNGQSIILPFVQGMHVGRTF